MVLRTGFNPNRAPSNFIWSSNSRNLRVAVIVIDSAGIGVMPKHPKADDGANTIANAAAYYNWKQPGQFRLPNMQQLGLGNIAEIPGVPPVENPAGAYGVLALDSVMTDTITGHWGLMGLKTGEYPTYPGGLPTEMMARVENEVSRRLGCAVNFIKDGRNISGTTILELMGSEARQTGKPIFYTSTDSVLQIAFHVGWEKGSSLVPGEGDLYKVEGKYVVSRKEVERMYAITAACRAFSDESSKPEDKFLRVIARPFATRTSPGPKGEQFSRITSLRRDATLVVPDYTVLDYAQKAGLSTVGVGKFFDIFSGRGISVGYPNPAEHRHLRDDMEGIDFIVQALGAEHPGIIGVNLVDCDEGFGHRNDPIGYAENLMRIDARLPEVFAAMGDYDVVMITADHGNDPTRGLSKLWLDQGLMGPDLFKVRGTNHSREFVPLLVFGTGVNRGGDLGILNMTDVGATIASYLRCCATQYGTSFLNQIVGKD